MDDRNLVYAVVIAFVVTLALTPMVRYLALSWQLLDTPNHRSSHTVPVPRIGGAAIVTGTLMGAALLLGTQSQEYVLLVVAAVVLIVGGIWDDLKTLSAAQKYLPQLVAALITAVALPGQLVVDIPTFSIDLEGWPARLIIATWVLVVVNVVNFMDGLDGLVAGTAAIAALASALIVGAQGFWLPVLAAALSGFLAWNISPASIFMGDGGSQFIGFSLAVGSLIRSEGSPHLTLALIILSPFLIDTSYTLLKRLLAGKNVFKAHREHLYQRMTQVGWTHRIVANIHYGFAALSGLAAVWLTDGVGWPRWIGVGLLLTLYSAYIIVAERVLPNRETANR